jgi:very-short-patch-repair endonuclease
MLRKNMTDAERKLWSKLRANQLGVKFRRQVPFGSFIVDFMSLGGRLIIELDGSQHYEEQAVQRDKLRDDYFAKEGFTVIRFNNTEIMENMDGVLDTIWQKLPNKQDG